MEADFRLALYEIKADLKPLLNALIYPMLDDRMITLASHHYMEEGSHIRNTIYLLGIGCFSGLGGTEALARATHCFLGTSPHGNDDLHLRFTIALLSLSLVHCTSTRINLQT
jgi:hypothetical protein